MQLAIEITRRHAVRAAHDVGETRDTGLDEIFFHVLPHVAWRRAVKRQVAAFRANYHFFTGKSAAVQFGQCGANRSFAPLKPVIRRGVYYVCAQLDGAHHCFGVTAISFFVGVTQISAQADG